MDFEGFIKEGKVILGERDLQKAKALIKMSSNNLKTVSKLKIDDNSASVLFSMLYESFRQIIEAMCLTEGYKVYSHEALTFYLKKKFEESTANTFDRYRKIRNGVNYYGEPVQIDTTIEAKKEINRLTKLLIQKYLNFSNENNCPKEAINDKPK